MEAHATHHLVFVYGTLKPGGFYWPRFCEGKVAAAMPAKARGELYDLGPGYPAARFGGDPWIHGFVLAFERDEDFLALDVLEGYQSGRAGHENEYQRIQVRCFDPTGADIGEVWSYEMTAEKIRQLGGTLVHGGDWQHTA